MSLEELQSLIKKLAEAVDGALIVTPKERQYLHSILCVRYSERFLEKVEVVS